MSKSSLFKTTLRLNLNNAEDLEAWNNLMSVDSRKPEYSSYCCRTIVTAINDHFARLGQPESQAHEAALLQKIEATIRDAVAENLKNVSFTAGVSARQAPMAQDQTDISDQSEAAIEAFLDNF